MSASSNHPSASIALAPRTSWNRGQSVWGVAYIPSTVGFSLALGGVNLGFTFVPFGGLGAFFLGVPFCALIFKGMFSALSKGRQPTVLQALWASAIVLGPPVFALARDLSLALDDGGNFRVFALLFAALLPLNVAWALLAMHFWKNSLAAGQSAT